MADRDRGARSFWSSEDEEDWDILDAEMRKLLGGRSRGVRLSEDFAVDRVQSGVETLRQRHAPVGSGDDRAGDPLELTQMRTELAEAEGRLQARRAELDEVLLQRDYVVTTRDELRSELGALIESRRHFFDSCARERNEKALHSRICQARTRATDQEAADLRAVLLRSNDDASQAFADITAQLEAELNAVILEALNARAELDRFYEMDGGGQQDFPVFQTFSGGDNLTTSTSTGPCGDAGGYGIIGNATRVNTAVFQPVAGGIMSSAAAPGASSDYWSGRVMAASHAATAGATVLSTVGTNTMTAAHTTNSVQSVPRLMQGTQEAATTGVGLPLSTVVVRPAAPQLNTSHSTSSTVAAPQIQTIRPQAPPVQQAQTVQPQAPQKTQVQIPTFEAIDKTGDGFITREQFIKAVIEQKRKQEAPVLATTSLATQAPVPLTQLAVPSAPRPTVAAVTTPSPGVVGNKVPVAAVWRRSA